MRIITLLFIILIIIIFILLKILNKINDKYGILRDKTFDEELDELTEKIKNDKK